MNTEKQKILEMLENGSITAREAAQLLDCVEDKGSKTPQSADKPKNNGKKIRVQVKGYSPDNQKVDINVSVPLALTRLVDNIVENCLPNAANEELARQGINLKALHLSDMIETLETMEEDIVDLDVDGEDTKMKVKVYVE